MLGAQLDYKTRTLTLQNIKIPFFLEINNQKVYRSVTNPHYLEIPVTIDEGDVLIPPIKISNDLVIPECISCAHEGICKIPNPFEITEVNFTERISVTPTEYVHVESPSMTEPNNLPKISELIRVGHLNEEEKKEILHLCTKYKDVFYYENTDLTFNNKVKHKIRVTTEQPIYVKSFRHPKSMQEEIQKQIQKLLDNKIIRPSISPYSAPVWIVPKKMDASGQKKYRMVIDYRKLNEHTIEDKYPLPRIDEILDNLGRCTYFTTLDLAQGFHQIEMDPDSIEKTAFTVNNGHYEYLRMPFGLKNAPATFQRMMDEVLKEYLYKFCFVYMDDVVIFSKSLQEHLQHIKLIFQRLKEVNLKIQLDKSEFLCKEVAFLGHVITPEGIKPNPSKIEAVLKYPVPKTIKEIKSFLGLVGYYRRFISGFAKLTAPMTKCLRKGTRINIDDPDYKECFELCKELLTNAPILKYPDFEKPFKLTTDASNISIGGVLSQCNQPIGYYSRTLNSAEKNYSTIEKELLAILDCTKHFRPYLYGRKFIIETDHNPLVWLYKIKEPNSRLVRWKLKLEEFDFDIIYKKGKENKVADALSRIEINTKEISTIANNDNLDTLSIVPNINEDIPELTLQEMDEIIENLGSDKNSSDPSDPEDNIPLSELINKALEEHQITEPIVQQNIEPSESGDTQHSVSEEDDGKILPIVEYPVNHFQNRIILYFGNNYEIRLKRPFKRNHYSVFLRKQNILFDINAMMKEILRPDITYGIYSKEPFLIDSFRKISKTFLNNQVKLFIATKFTADIVNEEDQQSIVSKYHDETHTGINETYNHLKTKYFWPNMKSIITNEINKCELCLQAKYERNPYNVKFQGPLLARKPFDTLFIDTFSFQNCKFLTIIDSFSRYAQAYYVKDGTAITILNKLRHYFSHHNYPKKIVSDEGREFFNKTLKEFCQLHKIELHYTTINNPNSNSPIERFHSTLVEKLRILRLKSSNETPQNQMISAVLIYNQSIHSSTGFSPFSLLYGPYENEIDIDLNLTIYEEYNNKRKNEIIPFLDQIYNKNKEKAQKILDNRNINKIDPPEINSDVAFARKNKPGKTDPLYEKVVITNKTNNKISGKSVKGKITNSHLRNIKRLRKPFSLQVPRDPDPIPSTSSNTN